jgi:hypothetical protein
LSFRQTIVVPSEESAFPVLLIAWLKFFAMKPVSLIPVARQEKGILRRAGLFKSIKLTLEHGAYTLVTG